MPFDFDDEEDDDHHHPEEEEEEEESFVLFCPSREGVEKIG